MRVAIIHPWLPQYRVPFFERLADDARVEGIEVRVFHGAVPLEWKDRGDSKSDPRFVELPTRHLTLGRSRSLNYKHLKPLGELRSYDLIVLEQAVRNLETYELMARRAPLAFWGHGKTYTKRVSGLQERLKMRLTMRGNWFFSYTTGGAKAVVDAGFPAERITVVRNSVDTSALKTSIDSLRREEVAAFESAHGLRGKTALFIGGLDASKRLPFLIDAAKIAGARDPDFRLLLAGDGNERPFVVAASRESSCIRYLGPIHGTDKALAMSVSQVLAMPGRVGLVAVDSFASARPIITTDWPWHAPEFDYLTASNAVVVEDGVHAYADALVRTLSDSQRLKSLQDACRAESLNYSVSSMSANFVAGLVAFCESRA